MSGERTYPKSIRFTQDELNRIEKAAIKKIVKTDELMTFSDYVRNATLKAVEEE